MFHVIFLKHTLCRRYLFVYRIIDEQTTGMTKGKGEEERGDALRVPKMCRCVCARERDRNFIVRFLRYTKENKSTLVPEIFVSLGRSGGKIITRERSMCYENNVIFFFSLIFSPPFFLLLFLDAHSKVRNGRAEKRDSMLILIHRRIVNITLLVSCGRTRHRKRYTSVYLYMYILIRIHPQLNC